jgi:hypothetical protein
MTKEEKEAILYIIEDLETPLYRHLEVGFRHSPLTNKEIIERYKEACEYATYNLKKLLETSDE